MSDPPRFLKGDGSRLGSRLLRSAEGDDPPVKARQRALVALGLGAGITTSVAAGTSVAAAGTSVAAAGTSVAAAGTSVAAAGTSVAKASLAIVVAKWALTGAALAGLTVGIVHRVQTTHSVDRRVDSRAAAPSVAPPRRASATPDRVSTEQVLPVDSPPADAVEAPPIAAPFENRVAARSPAPRADGVAARSGALGGAVAPVALSDEVAVLDGAREALSAGQTDRALSLLNNYDRTSPSKTLLLESKVLRIEALAQRGDRAQASRLAQAFLAEHPSSAHAARVRSLLVGLQKTAAP